jgi:lambda family phage holin
MIGFVLLASSSRIPLHSRRLTGCSTLEHLKELFIEGFKVPPMVAGFFLAIVIAFLRGQGNDRDWTTNVLEALLCGALALAFGSAITAMGLDQNWTLFIGGVTGFIGSQGVKELLVRLIKKKIG